MGSAIVHLPDPKGCLTRKTVVRSSDVSSLTARGRARRVTAAHDDVRWTWRRTDNLVRKREVRPNQKPH